MVSECSRAQLLNSEGDQKSLVIFGQILMMEIFLTFLRVGGKKKEQSLCNDTSRYRN